MKKTPQPKKLALNKETVRLLAEWQLTQAAGGSAESVCCVTATCQDTKTCESPTAVCSGTC